jgi:hypothetical protein
MFSGMRVLLIVGIDAILIWRVTVTVSLLQGIWARFQDHLD